MTPFVSLFALPQARGTSTNLLTAESHGHIFYLCQIRPWCNVPGTPSWTRGGSHLKHWSLLLAFTGLDLHDSYIRPLWLPSERRLLINSTWFFSEILLKGEGKAVEAQQRHSESCLICAVSLAGRNTLPPVQFVAVLKQHKICLFFKSNCKQIQIKQAWL